MTAQLLPNGGARGGGCGGGSPAAVAASSCAMIVVRLLMKRSTAWDTACLPVMIMRLMSSGSVSSLDASNSLRALSRITCRARARDGAELLPVGDQPKIAMCVLRQMPAGNDTGVP